MEIELKTVSTKKFLLITLLSIPIIIFLSVGLAILTKTRWLIYLIVPFWGLIIFLGQRFSKKVTNIDLNEGEYLKIDNVKIEYKNIIGYFINDNGLLQTAICFRLNTNKTIQIIGTSVGEQGKAFQKVQDEIIRILKSKNSQLVELEYKDLYVRQTNILRQIINVLVVIVIILYLIAIYFLMTEKIELPWQVFLVNLLLFRLMPYLKKKEK